MGKWREVLMNFNKKKVKCSLDPLTQKIEERKKDWLEK